VVLPPGATEPDCTSGVGQPVYPPMALAAGFEGEVSVKVVVKVDGSVEVVKFIKRDPNFDGAVTDFLKTLRCRAAVYNGSNIAVFKNLRFPFRRRQ
jgi:TonB family protein